MAGGEYIYVIHVENSNCSKTLTILQMICFRMNCGKASWSLVLNSTSTFNNNKKKRLKLRYVNLFHLANHLHYQRKKGKKKIHL